MQPVTVICGESPLILGQPHAGLFLPPDIHERLNAVGRDLADADWHFDRLYDSVAPSATVVRANFHRYVIDANRDPSGASLYPGQNTTGLVPFTTFDGETIWATPPDETEIEMRRRQYHAGYHKALSDEIARVKSLHGVAVVYDCHSIRSQIDYLFDGRLPDFNIGDNNGSTCAPAITQAAADICKGARGYTSVVNGRFRGGWTTRHYGQPQSGVHAIQMELAQSTYLAAENAPFEIDNAKADKLRIVLRDVLGAIEEIALSGALSGEKR
ncbi:MAG: N-formylglutamate deformylase [Parvularculaceae bacterium]|nr:N-formylglutamate deformylase [Parvularculaceae bacterium]